MMGAESEVGNCSLNYIHPSTLAFKISALDWPPNHSAHYMTHAAMIWIDTLSPDAVRTLHEHVKERPANPQTHPALASVVRAAAHVWEGNDEEHLCRLRITEGFT